MFYFLLGIIIVVIIVIIIVAVILEFNETTIHQRLNEEMYGVEFNENWFPPVKNSIKYFGEVKSGKEISNKKSVIIAGLAYNLGRSNSYRLMKRLDLIAKNFKTTTVLIYAADSPDDTIKWISEEFVRCKYITKLVLPKKVINIKTCKTRFSKMTRLRNGLIDEVRKLTGDYVLFMDYDMEGSISNDGLNHAIFYLEKEDGYDVMGANGLVNLTGLHLILYHFGYNMYDQLAAIELNGNPLTSLTTFTKSRGDDVFPIKSCFGGITIYKKHLIDKYNYMMENKEGETCEQDQVCEHWVFNKQIHNAGYKLAIDPNFILIAGRQGEGMHKK